MSILSELNADLAPDFELAEHQAVELVKTLPDGLVQEVIEQYSQRLDIDSYHGVCHWERVFVNGLVLANMIHEVNYPTTPKAIMLFALFHDSMRFDEGQDINHGMRGADYFFQMCDKYPELKRLLPINSRTVIGKACRWHTLQLHDDISSVALCFDADRLDLMRVGIYPELPYLNYRSAITEQLISQCSERAVKPLDVKIFRS